MSYNPSVGRWMQEDPAGYIDGANEYQLEESSPVDMVDPSGLWGEIVFDGPFSAKQKTDLTTAASDVAKRAAVVEGQVRMAWRVVKDISSSAGNCPCKKLAADLVDELNNLSSVLTRMEVYGESDSEGDLKFYDENFGDPDIQAKTNWSLLGMGSTARIKLNSGAAPTNFASMNQAALDELVFHEESHLFDTDDGEAGNDFNDAHTIEFLMHQDLNQLVWFRAPITALINCLKKNGNKNEASTLQDMLKNLNTDGYFDKYFQGRDPKLPD